MTPPPGPLDDKYNEPRLTRTAYAWLALDTEAIQLLQAAGGGITSSYIANIRAGRARPNQDHMGLALDTLRLAQPAAAESLARAYILDITPAEHLDQLTEILRHAPLIAPTHAPTLPDNPTHLLALSNLRRLASTDATIREAIILISKHI
jgi:hypothetical protein